MSQPSSTPPPESASRAGRLDRILRELLHQTPGVEAAAVVSFDGLPMASALPDGMDEDRVAAMSAALLSLAERAAQGLGRGDLSQVYIEGEHGTVFLVSAQDEGVLIAVTSAGAKVGMMLYEVKLAANRVGEVLHGPVPLPAPLPSHVTRDYIEERRTEPVAAVAAAPVAAAPVAAAPVASVAAPVAAPAVAAAPTVAEVAASYADPDAPSPYAEPSYGEHSYVGAADQAYSEPAYSEPAYSEPAYSEQGYGEPAYGEQAYAAASAYPQPVDDNAATEVVSSVPAVEQSTWSSYAPTGSVLPGERTSWS